MGVSRSLLLARDPKHASLLIILNVYSYLQQESPTFCRCSYGYRHLFNRVINRNAISTVS